MLQHRLVQQQVAQAKFKSVHETVAWMGAMQGQDYAGVKWSMGLRVPGNTDATIEQALVDKRVVRTWAMRGTLHMMAAEDLRWLLHLLGTRVLASAAGRHRELELDAETFARTDALIAKTLSDGESHSRTSLIAMLNRHGISTQGQRAPHILQHAALRGLSCQTVAPRNTPTYIAIDDSLPQGRASDSDPAAVEQNGRRRTAAGG